MGSVERRAREREATRELIIDTAREMFAELGYEAVTMRAIADRIEYTPPAIYHHFRDKDDLIAEIMDRDFLALGRQFGKLGRIEDPVERIRAAARAYVDFALTHPNHYKMMFMTPLPPRVYSRGAIARRNPDQDAYAFLLRAVQDGMALGRFRPEYRDPEELAQLLWSAVHGIASLHIAKGESDWVEWRNPVKLGTTMCEAMMRGVLRP